MAVVILHVNKTKKLDTTKFKSGGLHEKHVMATWNLGNHLIICLQAQGNQAVTGTQQNETNPSKSVSSFGDAWRPMK